MKTTSLLRSRSLALATVTTAALLALAPGRAAADPAAIFVSNYNGGSTYGHPNLPAYDATGAAATGYTTPGGFSDPEGIAYDPANNNLYIADSATNQIRSFNATTGAETTSATGFGAVAGLNMPIGLAFSNGVVYAANWHNNTITAYNATTGKAPTSGFTAPSTSSLNYPYGVAARGTTLYVTNYGNSTVEAFNTATGQPAAGFTGIGNQSGLYAPIGIALYGNDLFVANAGNNNVSEFNATTGAVINQNFITGLADPWGIAVVGNELLVAPRDGKAIGAYGIPDVATYDNGPTFSNPNFLTGLSSPAFPGTSELPVPEPATWAGGALLLGAAGLALRRRMARA